MQPPNANAVGPLEVPHGRVATSFDDLDCGLVVLVHPQCHGTTADLIKHVHGWEAHGAKSEVSCSELSLRCTVTDHS